MQVCVRCLNPMAGAQPIKALILNTQRYAHAQGTGAQVATH